MDEKLKREIQDYIEGHNLCTIAIADGSTPSAHTLYYVSHGLHIYFESDPDSQKIHILKANPKISLTIDEDYSDWRKIKGIQLFGKANITDKKNAPVIHKAFAEKFPHIDEYGGIPEQHVFIEVIPEKINFLDFTKGFGRKQVYYTDEKKPILNW